MAPLVNPSVEKLRLLSCRPLQPSSEQPGGTPVASTGPCPDVLAPAVLQAFASPLSGLVGDKHDRAKMVAAGCFLWGIMTSAVGLSTSLGQVCSCGSNLLPSIKSISSDDACGL